MGAPYVVVDGAPLDLSRVKALHAKLLREAEWTRPDPEIRDGITVGLDAAALAEVIAEVDRSGALLEAKSLAIEALKLEVDRLKGKLVELQYSYEARGFELDGYGRRERGERL